MAGDGDEAEATDESGCDRKSITESKCCSFEKSATSKSSLLMVCILESAKSEEAMVESSGPKWSCGAISASVSGAVKCEECSGSARGNEAPIACVDEELEIEGPRLNGRQRFLVIPSP